MKYIIDENTLKGIADAVRIVEGTSANIPVNQLKTRIKALSAGEQALYKIGLLSDVHIQYDKDQDGNGHTDFEDAITFYAGAGVDAVCIAGDLTDNGSALNMEGWKTSRDNARGSIPIYACNGNHESKNISALMATNPLNLRPYLDTDATENGAPNFYKEINGDIFIFMPCFVGVAQGNSNVMFSAEILTWLENLLETYRNQRVFLFQHIPPRKDMTGNFADANGAYTYNLWGSNQSDRAQFLELMAHYKNVIWFSGHTHIKWEYETEYNGLNYMRWNTDGARMVHLSSTTVPRDIVNGTTSDMYAEGEAGLMEVYANKVKIKGYDLINKAYIEELNLEIDTTPVNIPAKEVVALSSISTNVNSLTVNENEAVPFNNIIVTATYSNGISATVTGWTYTNVDTSTAGTYTSTITYEGKTATITVIVNAVTVEPEPATLTSISAVKTVTTYNVGDTVSTNDITVTATYSDGTTETVTGWNTSTVDTSSAGTKTLTVSYNGKTATISIIVNAVQEEPQDEIINLVWHSGELNYTTGAITSSTSYAYTDDIQNVSGSTYTLATSAKYSSYPKIRVVEFDANRNILGYTEEILSASTNLTCEYTPRNANTAFFVLRMNVKTYLNELTNGAITLVRHN